jgi:hypothetical protein
MRRHELDPVSLTFGFAFTGLGLLFLVGRADQAFRLRWIWPILLLVLGVGILADLARHRDTEDDPVPVPASAPDRELAPPQDLDSDPAPPPDLASEGAVDDREHPI